MILLCPIHLGVKIELNFENKCHFFTYRSFPNLSLDVALQCVCFIDLRQDDLVVTLQRVKMMRYDKKECNIYGKKQRLFYSFSYCYCTKICI